MSDSAENDAPRMRTHSAGVMCHECKAVLVEARCSCGESHGYTYQQPSEWAARTWPDHPCFIPPGRGAFYEDHERDMQDPEYREAFEQATRMIAHGEGDADAAQ